MDFGSETKVGAANITIECHRAVTFPLQLAYFVAGCEVLHTICKEVGMGVTEDERAKFHNGDEAGEVENLGIRVATIKDTG